MKLLLVLGSDDSYSLIARYAKPLGLELIRYAHILKAMDNIDEIDPHAIIISARDFPRHWKTMVQFVRSDRPKETCPIIILKGDNFPLEESSKASFLGVSGVVTETLNTPEDVDRFQAILRRCVPVEEKRRAHRFNVEPGQKLGLVFTSPAGSALVTGEAKDVSAGGLALLPDNSSLMDDINMDTELGECSLRVGDSILSPKCRLARTGRVISLEFLSFPDGEKEILSDYLENLSPPREYEIVENPDNGFNAVSF